MWVEPLADFPCLTQVHHKSDWIAADQRHITRCRGGGGVANALKMEFVVSARRSVAWRGPHSWDYNLLVAFMKLHPTFM